MTTRRPGRDGLILAVGVAGLGAIVTALHLLGRGALAAPPVGTFAHLGPWATARGPVTVGLVLVRLVALGVGYHLIATTALGLVGRVLRRPTLSGWAERATLPLFRSTVRRAAGLGLSASAILVTPLPTVVAAPTSAAEQVVVERLSPDVVGPRSLVVLEKLDPAGMVPGEATLRAVASGRAAPSVAADEDHVVRPGDHLWSLAEERLADHLGRTPTETEVGRFWRQVVAANPQLTDPDLLFPGDTVRIPRLGAPREPITPAGQATLRLEPG